MIQGMIIKLIFNAIMKKINEKHNLNKMDKYVNEDNELDVQMKQQQKTIGRQGKTIEENEKEIAIMRNEIAALKEIAHAPQEYVCCKKCGCKIAKIKNK